MLTHYNIIFNFNGIDIFIFLLKNYIKIEAFWPPLQPWFAGFFMAGSYIGFEKAGQPHPDSYLSVETNSGAPVIGST